MWLQCSTAVHEDAGRQQHDPQRLEEMSASKAPDRHAPPLAIPTPDSQTLPSSAGPSAGSATGTPGDGGRVWVSLTEAADEVEPESVPRCPTAGHVSIEKSPRHHTRNNFALACCAAYSRVLLQTMIMSMGDYTCNICRRRFDSTTLKHLPPGRSSRWSCAACGDDYCFDCRPQKETTDLQQPGTKYQIQPVPANVEQYGLARASSAKELEEYDPIASTHSETRSTTPELMHENPTSAEPARHAPTPPARCGLGVRLCHSSLGKLSVDKILSGGAAEHEGSLKRGDQILSINENSTADLIDAEDVARSLVGDVGSTANLRVQRAEDVEHPFKVRLERRLFDGQFDSIHSGPPPEEPDVNTDSQERPHSMPSAGSNPQDELGAQNPALRAPLSAPAASKQTSPPSTETPAMLLQERLERAIRRRTPSATPDLAKSSAQWRSETPIEILLAKYTTSPSPGALTPSPLGAVSASPPAPSVPPGAASPSAPPPVLSALLASETSPTPRKLPDETGAQENFAGEGDVSKDPSVPIADDMCQRLYLQAEMMASRPGLQDLNCCIDHARVPSGEDKGSLSILGSQSSAPASAALDRRSWGLAQILGREPASGPREKNDPEAVEDDRIQSGSDMADLQGREAALVLDSSGQVHSTNKEPVAAEGRSRPSLDVSDTLPAGSMDEGERDSGSVFLSPAAVLPSAETVNDELLHTPAEMARTSQELGQKDADGDGSVMPSNPAQPLTAPHALGCPIPSIENLGTSGETEEMLAVALK